MSTGAIRAYPRPRPAIMPRAKLTPEQYASAGTEHSQQVALFMWAQEAREQYPELSYMFAIPNGGLRGRATAGRLKAEGVKPGAPDVCLPVRRDGYSGLYLEMKRPTKGHVTEEQTNFHEFLRKQGYFVAVCRSYSAARMCVEAYLAA